MEEELTCGICNNKISGEDEFCPNCGAIFIDDVKCYNHEDSEADGVCVICSFPFCENCGSNINDLFLCNEHEHYEIIQGMAKIFGTSDALQANYIMEILKQEELHPFLFDRKASAISLGGTDYSLFRASGEYNGHLINELKILVPFQEILQAENFIKNLQE